MKRLIEISPEWQDIMLKLGAGIGQNEYVSVELSESTLAALQSKGAQEYFMKLLKDKVKHLRLSYDVYSSGKEICIVGRSRIS